MTLKRSLAAAIVCLPALVGCTAEDPSRIELKPIAGNTFASFADVFITVLDDDDDDDGDDSDDNDSDGDHSDDDSEEDSDDDSAAAALPDTGAGENLNTVRTTGLALLFAGLLMILTTRAPRGRRVRS